MGIKTSGSDKPYKEPEPEPPQSTVLVQPPMSQWEALKKAGWWGRPDWVILILVLLVWVTGLYWKLFGEPTAIDLITLFLFSAHLLILWLIMLIYRCSWFVLRLNADVATMPDTAARMAVTYLQGTPPK